MIEFMNWFAQDEKHFLGTVFVIWLVGRIIVAAIHSTKSDEDV